MHYRVTLKIIAIMLVSLTFLSCLTTPDNEDNIDQVLVTFELSNINNKVKVGNDSLRIVSLRFLVGDAELKKGSADSLILNPRTFQVTHSVQDDEIKGLFSGGFDSDILFDGFDFEIKKATGDEGNIDPVFIDQDNGETYSMVINGSYNNSEFVFKSLRNFDFNFPIDNSGLEDSASVLYNLRLSTDINQWFLNSDGTQLLNPGSSSNAPAINDNISSSIFLQTIE